MGLRRHSPGDRLRIGIHRQLLEVPPHTGYGRVWSELLPRLGALADVEAGATDPDVWLVDGHSAEGSGEDPGHRAPVLAVVAEVGWGTPELDEDHGPGFVESISAATEAAVTRADDVVTCSRSSKDQVMRAYGKPRDRVHVVPHGVDLALFNPDNPMAPDFFRHRAGVDLPYILFAASLHPRKNLPIVREAVTTLAQRGFPHALAIVASTAPGWSDSSDLAQRAFAELPGFPGRVFRFADPSDEELSALMSGADAVCQPSKLEGFGLTVLEAMAAGAPVVVANRGSLPDIVGRAGRVVEPTVDEVTRALADIVGNPGVARRLRRRARRRAETMSWDRTAEGWLRVLRRTAARRRPDGLAKRSVAPGGGR